MLALKTLSKIRKNAKSRLFSLILLMKSTKNVKYIEKKEEKMKKIIISVLIAAVVLGGYYGYKRFTAPTGQATGQAMPVEVIVAKNKAFYPSASFVAKIEAKDKVAVRARVVGFLTERLFNEGDFVNEGQSLFLIEKDQFEANVRKHEANLAKAQANEQNTKAQYERAKNLYKTKDVSEAVLDERNADYASAQAQVKQAQSDLDIAKLDLDYTDIKAPISGRIGESLYSVGALIGPDSGPLASIVSTTPMYAVFSVSENQLLQMRNFMKQSGSISAAPAEGAVDISFKMSDGSTHSLTGTMNFIDTELDAQMNTLKMRVSLPNPDNQLIANQYGRIEMKFKLPQQALLIPQLAVQRDLAGPYVLIVDKDNKLIQRRVTTGLELATGDVIIEKGVEQGQKILVNNFQKVYQGMTVHPIIKDAPEQTSAKQTESGA